MRASALAAVFSACALLAPAAHAWRAGPPAGKTGSPQSLGQTCRQCHGSAVGPGSVQILDVPATYAPNQVYTLRVRVSDPTRLGAGFEMSAETTAGHAGQWVIVDPLRTGYAEGFPQEPWICHTFDGVASAVANWASMGNAAEYTVAWRAPATNVGTVTFYAAGNAINNSFTNSGDTIYLTTASATFAPPPCPADLDGDGQVGASDLAALLGGWGAPGAADLDGDGSVGASDLATMLGAWGPCG